MCGLNFGEKRSIAHHILSENVFVLPLEYLPLFGESAIIKS